MTTRNRIAGVFLVMSTGACLEAPPRPAGDAGGPPASGDAAPGDAATDRGPIGNLVTLTFDDPEPADLVRDRSGNNHYGRHRNGLAAGRYGGGISRWLEIGPHPQIDRFNQSFTFEMWIEPTAITEAVLLDSWTGSETPLGYEVQLTEEGHLVLVSADGMGNTERSEATARAVRSETWNHVAVAWDRAEARFYIDGVLVDRVDHPAFDAPLEVPAVPVYFGARSGGTMRLMGNFDEVKLSDYAKTSAAIAESMSFDSTVLVGSCGDRIADSTTEYCDGQALCCDPAACTELVQDDGCDPVGTCAAGRCEIADAVRTTDGLLALWLFDVLNGNTVPEVSGAGTPLDLVADSTTGLMQQPGRLTLAQPSTLRVSSASRVVDACRQSDAYTVEAWVQPSSLEQEGPARVITMSVSTGSRNFLLGQDAEHWVGRARSEGSTSNGKPDIASGEGDVSLAIHHLVLTVENDQRRLYVDGRLRDVSTVLGGLKGWENYPILVGDEEGGMRAWLGDIHLIAIYDRALSEIDIATNYSAGPDPELDES